MILLRAHFFLAHPTRACSLLGLHLLYQLLHLLIAPVLIEEVPPLSYLIGHLSQQLLILVSSCPQCGVRLGGLVLCEARVRLLKAPQVMPVAVQLF